MNEYDKKILSILNQLVLESASINTGDENYKKWNAKALIIIDSVLGPGPHNVHSPPYYDFSNAKDKESKVGVLEGLIQRIQIDGKVEKYVKEKNEKFSDIENFDRKSWSKVIFLAHASEDKEFVRRLYKRLKKSGLEPWLDEENLMPGVRWNDKIKEAIKNSRFFLACISKNSVEKNGYIQRELRMALNELEQKAPDVIYFIPALIDEVELPNISVGTINLQDYQAINISKDEGISKLISHLQKQVNIIEEVEKKEKPEFSSVRNAIMHGKINEAIKILNDYASKNDIDLSNNVILLSSRYRRLKDSEIQGTITREDYEIQSNQIVYSLLETLKLIEAGEGGII